VKYKWFTWELDINLRSLLIWDTRGVIILLEESKESLIVTHFGIIVFVLEGCSWPAQFYIVRVETHVTPSNGVIWGWERGVPACIGLRGLHYGPGKGGNWRGHRALRGNSLESWGILTNSSCILVIQRCKGGGSDLLSSLFFLFLLQIKLLCVLWNKLRLWLSI